MHYTTITAGELRKMDGVKVRAKTDTGVIIEGEEVYISDVSVENAIKKQCKNIYLMKSKMGKHLVVCNSNRIEYGNGRNFSVCIYSYVAKIPK